MSKDNKDEELLGWCAMRPIVLSARDTFLQTLIDSGQARVVSDMPKPQRQAELVVQPRYEYVFNDVPAIKRIELNGLAEHIAEAEAKHATKH